MARPKRKTEVTTLKLTPQVRSLWEMCAEAEHRTLTNMFEAMVYDYAKRLGVGQPAQAFEDKTESGESNLS